MSFGTSSMSSTHVTLFLRRMAVCNFFFFHINDWTCIPAGGQSVFDDTCRSVLPLSWPVRHIHVILFLRWVTVCYSHFFISDSKTYESARYTSKWMSEKQNCFLLDSNNHGNSQKRTILTKTSKAHRFGDKFDVFRIQLIAENALSGRV